MKKSLILLAKIWFSLTVLMVFTSCNPFSSPTQIKKSEYMLQEGKAGAVGILHDHLNKPVENEVVRLALVIWNDDHTEAGFVIDGANSPSSLTTEKGEFNFLDISPGEYVLVIRNVDDNPIVIPTEDNNNVAKIFVLNANEVIELGVITIDTTK